MRTVNIGSEYTTEGELEKIYDSLH